MSVTRDAALHTLQEEQTRLKMRLQELQQLKRELGDAPQGKVPFPVPEIPLVFQGHTQQDKDVPKSLVFKVRISYPLPGGSALVTFEDPKVAAQVLQHKEHQIKVEECRLQVQVQPLELPMVTTIQVIEWRGPGVGRGRCVPAHRGVGWAWPGTIPSHLLLGV